MCKPAIHVWSCVVYEACLSVLLIAWAWSGHHLVESKSGQAHKHEEHWKLSDTISETPRQQIVYREICRCVSHLLCNCFFKDFVVVGVFCRAFSPVILGSGRTRTTSRPSSFWPQTFCQFWRSEVRYCVIWQRRSLFLSWAHCPQSAFFFCYVRHCGIAAERRAGKEYLYLLEGVT